jgi:hypothetical protein
VDSDASASPNDASILALKSVAHWSPENAAVIRSAESIAAEAD